MISDSWQDWLAVLGYTKSASGKPLFLLPSQTLLSSLPRRFAPASLRPAFCLLPHLVFK